MLLRQNCGQRPQNHLAMFIVRQLFVLVVCEGLEEHYIGLAQGPSNLAFNQSWQPICKVDALRLQILLRLLVWPEHAG